MRDALPNATGVQSARIPEKIRMRSDHAPQRRQSGHPRNGYEAPNRFDAPPKRHPQRRSPSPTMDPSYNPSSHSNPPMRAVRSDRSVASDTEAYPSSARYQAHRARNEGYMQPKRTSSESPRRDLHPSRSRETERDRDGLARNRSSSVPSRQSPRQKNFSAAAEQQHLRDSVYNRDDRFSDHEGGRVVSNRLRVNSGNRDLYRHHPEPAATSTSLRRRPPNAELQKAAKSIKTKPVDDQSGGDNRSERKQKGGVPQRNSDRRTMVGSHHRTPETGQPERIYVAVQGDQKPESRIRGNLEDRPLPRKDIRTFATTTQLVNNNARKPQAFTERRDPPKSTSKPIDSTEPRDPPLKSRLALQPTEQKSATIKSALDQVAPFIRTTNLHRKLNNANVVIQDRKSEASSSSSSSSLSQKELGGIARKALHLSKTSNRQAPSPRDESPISRLLSENISTATPKSTKSVSSSAIASNRSYLQKGAKKDPSDHYESPISKLLSEKLTATPAKTSSKPVSCTALASSEKVFPTGFQRAPYESPISKLLSEKAKSTSNPSTGSTTKPFSSSTLARGEKFSKKVQSKLSESDVKPSSDPAASYAYKSAARLSGQLSRGSQPTLPTILTMSYSESLSLQLSRSASPEKRARNCATPPGGFSASSSASASPTKSVRSAFDPPKYRRNKEVEEIRTEGASGASAIFRGLSRSNSSSPSKADKLLDRKLCSAQESVQRSLVRAKPHVASTDTKGQQKTSSLSRGEAEKSRNLNRAEAASAITLRAKSIAHGPPEKFRDLFDRAQAMSSDTQYQPKAKRLPSESPEKFPDTRQPSKTQEKSQDFHEPIRQPQLTTNILFNQAQQNGTHESSRRLHASAFPHGVKERSKQTPDDNERFHQPNKISNAQDSGLRRQPTGKEMLNRPQVKQFVKQAQLQSRQAKAEMFFDREQEKFSESEEIPEPVKKGQAPCDQQSNRTPKYVRQQQSKQVSEDTRLPFAPYRYSASPHSNRSPALEEENKDSDGRRREREFTLQPYFPGGKTAVHVQSSQTPTEPPVVITKIDQKRYSKHGGSNRTTNFASEQENELPKVAKYNPHMHHDEERILQNGSGKTIHSQFSQNPTEPPVVITKIDQKRYTNFASEQENELPKVAKYNRHTHHDEERIRQNGSGKIIHAQSSQNRTEPPVVITKIDQERYSKHGGSDSTTNLGSGQESELPKVAKYNPHTHYEEERLRQNGSREALAWPCSPDNKSYVQHRVMEFEESRTMNSGTQDEGECPQESPTQNDRNSQHTQQQLSVCSSGTSPVERKGSSLDYLSHVRRNHRETQEVRSGGKAVRPSRLTSTSRDPGGVYGSDDVSSVGFRAEPPGSSPHERWKTAASSEISSHRQGREAHRRSIHAHKSTHNEKHNKKRQAEIRRRAETMFLPAEQKVDAPTGRSQLDSIPQVNSAIISEIESVAASRSDLDQPHLDHPRGGVIKPLASLAGENHSKQEHGNSSANQMSRSDGYTESSDSRPDAFQWLHQKYGNKAPTANVDAIEKAKTKKVPPKAIVNVYGGPVRSPRIGIDDDEDVFFGLDDESDIGPKPIPLPTANIAPVQEEERPEPVQRDPMRKAGIQITEESERNFVDGPELQGPTPAERVNESTGRHTGKTLHETIFANTVISDLTTTLMTDRTKRAQFFKHNDSVLKIPKTPVSTQYTQSVVYEQASEDSTVQDQPCKKPPSVFTDISVAIANSLQLGACTVPDNVAAQMQQVPECAMTAKAQCAAKFDEAIDSFGMDQDSAGGTRDSLDPSGTDTTHTTTVLNDVEKRMWAAWDRRRSRTNETSPTKHVYERDLLPELEQSSSSTDSETKAKHYGLRQEAHDALVAHARKAVSIYGLDSFMTPEYDLRDISASDASSSQMPKPSAINSHVDGSYEAATSPSPTSRLSSVLSYKEQEMLEHFSSALKNKGIEVLKLGRRNIWQIRYLTVSKEVTKLQSGSMAGEIGQCPRALLWPKQFKSPNCSIANIKEHGRGGVMFEHIKKIRLATSSEQYDNHLPKKLKAMFPVFAGVVLDYVHNGGDRQLHLCFQSPPEAQAFITAMLIIREASERSATRKDDGSAYTTHSNSDSLLD